MKHWKDHLLPQIERGAYPLAAPNTIDLADARAATMRQVPPVCTA
jgi:hypothetical protein